MDIVFTHTHTACTHTHTACIHTHTQTHTLKLTHSLSHTLSHSLSLTLSLSLSLTLSHTLSLSFTHTHTLSLTFLFSLDHLLTSATVTKVFFDVASIKLSDTDAVTMVPLFTAVTGSAQHQRTNMKICRR